MHSISPASVSTILQPLAVHAGLSAAHGAPRVVEGSGGVSTFVVPSGITLTASLPLVTIAVIMSTISLYYYLQVIRQMYVIQADGHLIDPQAPDIVVERWRLTPSGYLATGSMFIGMFVIGLYAAPIMGAADRAAAALFS